MIVMVNKLTKTLQNLKDLQLLINHYEEHKEKITEFNFIQCEVFSFFLKELLKYIEQDIQLINLKKLKFSYLDQVSMYSYKLYIADSEAKKGRHLFDNKSIGKLIYIEKNK